MKKLYLLFILLILPVFLHAQNAAELEAVLGVPRVSCSQAARFILASINDNAGGDAFEQAVSRGWLKNASAGDAITLGQLSFLIMKAFDLKGGMMYTILPGPRYAYKSLVSRNFIQGAADPAMNVNGERFLLILGRVLSSEGGES
ncbi:MAG: hypothetical protein FWD40_08075 [Treponema sp.]|nr:hypothetical protein [Treponema sp.]